MLFEMLWGLLNQLDQSLPCCCITYTHHTVLNCPLVDYDMIIQAKKLFHQLNCLKSVHHDSINHAAFIKMNCGITFSPS